MSRPGLAWCGSCDPFHWKAMKHSPSFCSSRRTSVLLTTPKQTARSAKPARVVNWNPQNSNRDQISDSAKVFQVLHLNFVNSGPTSQKAKLQRRVCDGSDPGHVNTRHTYHKSESSQKPAVEESTSYRHVTSWNPRNGFSIIKAS